MLGTRAAPFLTGVTFATTATAEVIELELGAPTHHHPTYSVLILHKRNQARFNASQSHPARSLASVAAIASMMARRSLERIVVSITVLQGFLIRSRPHRLRHVKAQRSFHQDALDLACSRCSRHNPAAAPAVSPRRICSPMNF